MMTFFTFTVTIISVSILQFVCGQSKGLWFYDFPPSQIDATNSLVRNEFPENFIFGASISSYQNEGAWNVSGRTMSIWDYALHEYPNLVADKGNADISADFYHRYKEDIKLAKSLGCKMFRISISWPRLLPTGFTNYINEDGIRFYNDVINELIANGITPMVTLLHADVPIGLYQLGSFCNPHLIEFFTAYARVAFTFFGDRVKHWVTINEPGVMCFIHLRQRPPLGFDMNGVMEYDCLYSVLLAHASIYRMYYREFASWQKGKLGFTFNAARFRPRTNSEADIIGAYDSILWLNGVLLNALLRKNKDMPTRMQDRINYLSYMQGFPKSRLRTFTESEIRLMEGTVDFIGLNFYHAINESAVPEDYTTVSVNNDIGVNFFAYKEITYAYQTTPLALRELTDYLLTHYEMPDIYITECGYLDDTRVQDAERALYFHTMLKEILIMLQDGYNYKGFLLWTLTDNFSWITGYMVKPGIVKIDFANATLPRIPKLSSKIISSIYHERRVKPVLEMLTAKEDIFAMKEMLSSLNSTEL